MSEEDSKLSRLTKAGIGAGFLAKDILTSAITDVLEETDLDEERREKLEERLIQRAEAELENLSGSFRDKMEEGRQQAGLASEETVEALQERVSRIEKRLEELEGEK